MEHFAVAIAAWSGLLVRAAGITSLILVASLAAWSYL